ncbi:hypothetical protein HMPREF1987_00161 [Peptostreptococcaceae bacterium oral taxon 113 str. W5053]|nr:hypothetical protein HMPREF1987_00161 [Peptostreptococcaceae bacterium oral taxon 113 str. W5053]
MEFQQFIQKKRSVIYDHKNIKSFLTKVHDTVDFHGKRGLSIQNTAQRMSIGR